MKDNGIMIKNKDLVHFFITHMVRNMLEVFLKEKNTVKGFIAFVFLK